MPAEPPEGFISSADACRLLRISDRTLRRRVKAGEIEGEYILRPQGSILYVKLSADAAEQTADETAPPADASSEGPEAAPETRQDTAVVAMLLERLDGKDAAILAATERAVRAETALEAAHQAAEAARAHLATVQAELERERQAGDRLRARRWWRWW